MREITANITVMIHLYEGEEDLSIDDTCLPLENEGWCIQSAFIQEEN